MNNRQYRTGRLALTAFFLTALLLSVMGGLWWVDRTCGRTVTGNTPHFTAAAADGTVSADSTLNIANGANSPAASVTSTVVRCLPPRIAVLCCCLQQEQQLLSLLFPEE